MAVLAVIAGNFYRKKKGETHISSQTCVQMKNTMTSRTENLKYSLCVFREVSVAQGNAFQEESCGWVSLDSFQSTIYHRNSKIVK